MAGEHTACTPDSRRACHVDGSGSSGGVPGLGARAWVPGHPYLVLDSVYDLVLDSVLLDLVLDSVLDLVSDPASGLVLDSVQALPPVSLSQITSKLLYMRRVGDESTRRVRDESIRRVETSQSDE